jgi:hypothetical protein
MSGFYYKEELMRKRFSLAFTLVMVLLMAGAVPMCADAACVNPPSGMVSWWGADNNALDIVGMNNGTIHGGVTYGQGEVGSAFDFNSAVGTYLQIPSSAALNIQGSHSISAWVYMRNTSGTRLIAGKSGGTQFYSADGILHFVVYSGGTPYHVVSTTALTGNSWHHVTGVFDGNAGVSRLYVDGELNNTSISIPGQPDSNTNPYVFGGMSGFDYYLDGLIDEVAIFNRALTGTDVQNIFYAGSAGMCRPSVAPPAGLVSWWRGENDAADYKGSNNGSLANGATFAQGKVGQAFSLDGVDDYVQVPDSPSLNIGAGDFSLNLWVNYAVVKAGPSALLPNVFIAQDEGGGAAHKWIFFSSDSGLYFHINNAGPYTFVGPVAFTPQTGQWYYLTVTRSGNVFSFYVNGALAGTVTDSTPIPDVNASLTIGQSEGLGYFSGLIDETAIFNRALSADEIASIYNAGGSGMSFTPDTTPDAFSFISQTGMPTSTSIVSNPVTVTGINTSTALGIAGGAYSVSSDGGGTWSDFSTSTPATVNLNNQVMVRQTSSASNSTMTTATLTIGGVSGAFNVTTAALGDPNASGLVSWWKGNNNTLDSVGGNHGTLQGGAGYAGGASWQAFSFDGVDDYFRVFNPQNIPVGNSPRTVSAWIMSSAPTIGPNGPGYQTILGYGTPWIDGQTFLLEWGGDVNDRKLYLTGWNRDIAGSTSLNYNQWYHVTTTYDGTTVRLYINGVLDASADRSLNTIINASGLLIGNSPPNDGWHANFNGFIYGAKIFSRALSTTEISKLAGTLPDPFTFPPVFGATRSALVESEAITVTGISNPSNISISDGDEYRINGAWKSSPGTFNPGDTVKVRLTTSGSYSTLKTATLTIGGVEGTFSVTTLADTEKPVVTAFSLNTSISSAMSVIVDTFTATDNSGVVSGYRVTASATPPSPADPGWSAVSLPMTFILSMAGDNTLYAWAKDPAGNVSEPLTATVKLQPVHREPDKDYVSLQTAYGEADSDETIKVLAVTLPENIDLNKAMDISISGGYEDGFAGQSGYSTISGSLTVGKGTLTVERVVVK